MAKKKAKPNDGKTTVYTINEGDGTLYSGHTNNLDRRMAEHKRDHPDMERVYSKEYASKAAALDAERRLQARRKKER